MGPAATGWRPCTERPHPAGRSGPSGVEVRTHEHVAHAAASRRTSRRQLPGPSSHSSVSGSRQPSPQTGGPSGRPSAPIAAIAVTVRSVGAGVARVRRRRPGRLRAIASFPAEPPPASGGTTPVSRGAVRITECPNHSASCHREPSPSGNPVRGSSCPQPAYHRQGQGLAPSSTRRTTSTPCYASGLRACLGSADEEPRSNIELVRWTAAKSFAMLGFRPMLQRRTPICRDSRRLTSCFSSFHHLLRPSRSCPTSKLDPSAPIGPALTSGRDRELELHSAPPTGRWTKLGPGNRRRCTGCSSRPCSRHRANAPSASALAPSMKPGWTAPTRRQIPW